ncbi:MAG: hypothetical protein ABIO48_12365 [Pedococcus sp.]
MWTTSRWSIATSITSRSVHTLVLAIETKFVGAGRQWTTDRYREAAMDGARSSARSVRSILLSHGVKDAPVEPVLMVWGPAAAQLENDWAVVDGVHVVRGVAAADQWQRHCNSGDISPSRAKAIQEILITIRPCVMPTPEPRLVMHRRALAPSDRGSPAHAGRDLMQREPA